MTSIKNPSSESSPIVKVRKLIQNEKNPDPTTIANINDILEKRKKSFTCMISSLKNELEGLGLSYPDASVPMIGIIQIKFPDNRLVQVEYDKKTSLFLVFPKFKSDVDIFKPLTIADAVKQIKSFLYD